ncbi:hypothetical protein C0585_07800 [Candidatus Woesearchaeota archaeon]|nr:MAG: hypothetical protein C0585_07800 [Candidatus Woesearchaeota archaeon]
MRLLIHAINGVGLGHLVRTLEIAKNIRSLDSSLDISFVTNSEFTDLIAKQGFTFTRLDMNTKNVLNNEISYEKYLEYNFVAIKDILLKEKPDMILFDSEINLKLIDFCIDNDIKIGFILRNKKNSYFNDLIKEEIIKKFDIVLVPHLKKEVKPDQLKILEKLSNIFFIGPIIKFSERKISKKNSNDLNILICFAGGSDVKNNEPLFDNISSFLKELKKNKLVINGKNIDVNIITGPFFNDKKYSLEGFESKRFSYDLFNDIKDSDICIIPGGYNLVNEVVLAKTPSIIIPLDRKEDDQFLRVSRLEEKGCVISGEKEIFKKLEEIIRKDRLKEMQKCFPGLKQGNIEGAKKILKFLKKEYGKEDNIAVVKGEWLDISEKFIFDEIRNMKRFVPYIFCLNKKKDYESKNIFFDDKYSSLWKPSYPLIMRRSKGVYDEFINKCTKIIKDKKIRILHASYLTDAFFFLKLKTITDTRLISSVRGYDFYSKDLDYSKVFEKGDLFLVRSEIMKSDMIKKGCPKDKIKIHHSGVDTAFFSYKKRDLPKNKEIRFISIGRLIPKKGMIYTLKAFNLFNKKYPDSSLTIIGEGEEKKDLLNFIHENNLENKVILKDKVPNNKILDRLYENHIFILHSVTGKNNDSEGIPVVLMEAMSTGMPVISTFHKGISELIEQEKSGYLVKEKHAEGLFERMEYLYKNKDVWEKIGFSAREKVKKDFNIDIQNTLLEDIYEDLI